MSVGPQRGVALRRRKVQESEEITGNLEDSQGSINRLLFGGNESNSGQSSRSGVEPSVSFIKQIPPSSSSFNQQQQIIYGIQPPQNKLLLGGGNSSGGSESSASISGAINGKVGVLAPFSTTNLRHLAAHSQAVNSQIQQQTYPHINLQLAAAAAANHEALAAFGGGSNMLAAVPNQFNGIQCNNGQMSKGMPVKPPAITGLATVVNSVVNNGSSKQHQTLNSTKTNKSRQSTEGEYQV